MARVSISEAAKRGYAARMTIYRAIKDGRLTTQMEGKKKLLDIADLVSVFGEPGKKPSPDQAEAVEVGGLLSERDLLREENERLRRDLETARREVTDERDHGRKREDELLEMVFLTQKLLEDQTSRKGIIKRLFGR